MLAAKRHNMRDVSDRARRLMPLIRFSDNIDVEISRISTRVRRLRTFGTRQRNLGTSRSVTLRAKNKLWDDRRLSARQVAQSAMKEM